MFRVPLGMPSWGPKFFSLNFLAPFAKTPTSKKVVPKSRKNVQAELTLACGWNKLASPGRGVRCIFSELKLHYNDSSRICPRHHIWDKPYTNPLYLRHVLRRTDWSDSKIDLRRYSSVLDMETNPYITSVYCVGLWDDVSKYVNAGQSPRFHVIRNRQHACGQKRYTAWRVSGPTLKGGRRRRLEWERQTVVQGGDFDTRNSWWWRSHAGVVCSGSANSRHLLA